MTAIIALTVALAVFVGIALGHLAVGIAAAALTAVALEMHLACNETGFLSAAPPGGEPPRPRGGMSTGEYPRGYHGCNA